MRAISLHQPWASLIAANVKPYEFRSWAAPHWIIGQRIGIHAAARKPRLQELADIGGEVGLGRDSGCGLFLDAVSTGVALDILDAAWRGRLPLGAVVATAVIGLSIRVADGLPLLGIGPGGSTQFAWPMSHVVRLDPPMPAKGAQGFWHWRN